MFKLIILAVALALALSTIEKGYTITNVKQYNNEYYGANDNTTHVIIGTYLVEKQNVDALKILQSPYSFNININQALKGKTKYIKVFGEEQNYENLIKIDTTTVANGIKNNGQVKASNTFAVIDWNHNFQSNLDLEQTKYIPWLQKLLSSIPESFVKIPAHYLCKMIAGTQFHRYLNHKNYIIEMYGQENPYLTYESIFTQKDYEAKDGYSSECPKNPSTLKLKQILGQAKFYIEKSLQTEYRGYVGEMEQWIKEASTNNHYGGVVFFDSHPRNVIRL